VFDKLNAHPAVRHFNNDIGLPKELDPYMKTYFDTAVREGRYYTEDWTFCENWRDIGGQVFVDKRVLLRHTGTYVFDYNTHEQLYKDLKAMFEPGNIITPADVPVITDNSPKEVKTEVLASSKKKSKKAAAAA
jgi:hypothetical protein